MIRALWDFPRWLFRPCGPVDAVGLLTAAAILLALDFVPVSPWTGLLVAAVIGWAWGEAVNIAEQEESGLAW